LGVAVSQPAIFLGHGSPMNAINENDYTRALKGWKKPELPPKAILVISAHWETEGTWITGMDHPQTIHDFFGFPKALFEVQCPAPGDGKLAQKIATDLPDQNIQVDQEAWGLDHGTWAVLCHIYPEANIPVLQLSLDKKKSLKEHYELGRQLNYLRDEGVMILGSGNIVHNLRAIDWNLNAKPHHWNVEFDEWVAKHLEDKNFQPLVESPLKSEAGRLSIPTLEHYLPLLYVIGAADPRDSLDYLFEGYQNASMSMRCLSFG